MKKVIWGAVLLAMIIAGPIPTMAMGTVGVGVSVPLPPPIGFAGSPALVVIPETYIYAVPDVNEDVFFYGGWWWRPWEGRWYRSQQYNSGWRHYRETPSFYRSVPQNWRNDYRQGRWKGNQWDRQRIPHQQVEQNWKSWEKNQHWERQNSWGVKGLKRPRTPSQETSRRTERDQSRLQYSVPLPPPIGFAGSPALVVIPETYIYAVPDVNVDVFFYGGWWWRPWEGRWYRSQQYNSGWRHYRETPSFYRSVPQNWRNDYRQGRWKGNQWDRQRIPHQQVEQNWKSWEKNQHWERQNSWGVKGLKRTRTPSQEPSRRMEKDHSRPQDRDDQRHRR